jgi:hypothetical protein
MEIIEPGLVPAQQWRPDEPAGTDAGSLWLLGGVGRKPT